MNAGSAAPAATLTRHNDHAVPPAGRGYFLLAVLGISFWFCMAVPFASHRETYWWLAKVHTEDFTYALSFIASTYRPLHQVLTWTSFVLLDPEVFPTSALRQGVFQILIYALFMLAWWIMFRASEQRRCFALVACLAGATFFSGYVHLFHIYGTSYVPVMLTLGALLWSSARGLSRRHELLLALCAIVLVLWHPFATALFIGFYFGHYVDTFSQRGKEEHVRALCLLAIACIVVIGSVVMLPRLLPQTSTLLVETATRPASTRLLAFVLSYKTNEVNLAASAVAAMLTAALVLAVGGGMKRRAAALLGVALSTALFVAAGMPVVLLWLLAVLAKLLVLRRWSLFFLMLTAMLLPFGGGIGTPIHALFAIIAAVYVTPLGWRHAERALSVISPLYPPLIVGAALLIVAAIRAGARRSRRDTAGAASAG